MPLLLSQGPVGSTGTDRGLPQPSEGDYPDQTAAPFGGAGCVPSGVPSLPGAAPLVCPKNFFASLWFCGATGRYGPKVVGRRIQSQQTLVDDDTVCFGHLLGNELHHPLQRDVRQPRLVLGIASSDIGVIAGEPDLIELLRFVLPVGPLHGAGASPRYPFEILPALVDRLEGSGVLDVGGEVTIVRPVGKKPLPTDRCDGVPDANEIGRSARSTSSLRRMGGSELLRSFCRIRFVSRHSDLVDAGNRIFGHLAQRFRIEADRVAVSLLGRDAAKLEHVRKTPGGVGAPTEAEKIDTILRLPHADERHVAVDDLFRDAEPEHLLQRLLLPVSTAVVPRRRRSDAGNVERQLLLWIDDRVGTGARRTVQLVDVRPALVRKKAAFVSRAVGENQDVLGQVCLPQVTIGSSDASATASPVASVKIAATSRAFWRYAS